MKHIISLIILLLASLAKGQQVSPEAAVDAYFKYYKAGDTIGLKQVFHPDFTLSYISPWEKGANAYKSVSRSEMMHFFNNNWSRLSITCKRDELDVSDNIAYSKVTVRLEGIVEWTDVITLIKIEGKWWIIAKASTGELLRKDSSAGG